MGYFHRLNALSKEQYNYIKDLSKEELGKQYGEVENDGSVYIDFQRELGLREIYNLGKYIDFKYEPFTKNALTFEDGDTEFLLANEAMFIALIEFYRQEIFDYYKDLLDEVEKPNKEEIELERFRRFFYGMKHEWGQSYPPYQLKVDREELVTSWKYEYVIFELVRLYKAFDWEKDVLILTGG